MIKGTQDGFFIIGHGTDTVPWNSLGSIFTSYKYDGTINFSKYTLDRDEERFYYDLNCAVIDSLAYTVFVGTTPIQILQFNIHTGRIVQRNELLNQIDNSIPPFSYSIHQVDSTHLLVNSSILINHNHNITQLSLFNRIDQSLIYYFNGYLDFDQEITDVLIGPNGYILGGYIRRGDPWTLDFESHATIVWLDKNFIETHRYISNDETWEIFGKDLLIDHEGSIVSTNCIGRKYVVGNNYFDEWRPSVYKVDSMGKFLWQRPMGRDFYIDIHYTFNCLIPSNLGDGFIAAGAQTNFSDSIYYSGSNYNEKGENLRFEALISKVSNDGDSLWSRWYYKSDFLFSISEFHDIIPHPEGGYLLSGEANKEPLSPGKTEIYTWLLYVDEYGCAVPGCQNIVKTDDPMLPDPIRLYPNPASDVLYVYQQENEMMQYMISDLQGRMIAKFTCSQGSSTVVTEVNSYPPGEYILIKTDSKGRTRSEKWIKI
ncbi:MAG: T9SS type A sorting domain-containing protein [Saprospiraceae bacterium]